MRRAFVILPLLLVAIGTIVGRSDGALTGDRSDLQVIDGDSLQIGGVVVHLSGFDAPELGQICLRHDRPWHCGLDAAYALRKLVTLAARGNIACLPAIEAPAMTVATCMDGREDVSHAMLSAAHGVAATPDDPFYEPATAPVYEAVEAEARAASLGIWDSRFVPPGDWRAGRRLPIEHDPAKACVIKGAVTDDGARLYYGPLDSDYKGIQVDEGRGGRWFCSDDEARAAGWRRLGEHAAS